MGIKEHDNKIDYSEIDWRFVDGIASRMNANKLKYPKGNSLNKISLELLEQALFRHVRKILQPVPGDPETIQDHLYAIGCNAMMITTQLCTYDEMN
ncbi:MAG: dATP/dGTP diphosphohydrolase domain-containing protein [Candidatus Absconditabacterales bacterium]